MQGAERVAVAGFSGAMVWHLTAEFGEFALRGTPENQVDLRRLAGLHRLLQHLDKAGITEIAVPVRTSSGQTFQTRRSLVWQLEPWRPGRADFQESPTPARLAAASQLLARWHRAAATFVAIPGEQPWFFVREAPSPTVQERRGELQSYSSTVRARIKSELQWRAQNDPLPQLGLRVLELFEQTAPRIAGELDAFREITVLLQPCLRDVWHDHLLFAGDEVTGLIDPHACRSDCVATDLSRLLRSLLKSDRPRWDWAIQQYETLRPLTLTERALIEVFDRSSVLLSGMTWLRWICLEQRRIDAPERVLSRLQEWLGALEELAGERSISG